MAFLKYADAIVNTPKLGSHKQWNKVRAASSLPSVQSVPVNNILSDFSPDKYLLTHATIVASVDVEPNDFYIKSCCSKYVNQNGDSWERKLLLSTFHTFIGAQNYLEHVQIPHLSKGRIIDAVARSVNDDESIYIDILVATSREHSDLVASIENGTLNTLSMGCSIKYSICSKCGNKAVDETELCDHIKYMKNQFFVDEDGQQRIIAELCGHRDEQESNVFIEASWVANPAFKGAVLRNIIVAKDDMETAKKIEKAYISRKAEFSNIDGFLKAASVDQIQELISKIGSALKKKADEPVTEIPPELQEGNPKNEEAKQQAQQSADEPEVDTEAVEAPPIQSDAQPAEQPTQPAEQPTQPAEQPTQPAEQPTQPAEQPAQPAEQPTQPAEQPAQPAEQPAQPAQAPQGEGSPESLEDLVTHVKKNIRQQIMDELSQEVQGMASQSFLDQTKNYPPLSTNDNLVKAFIEEYKPKTGWSSSKLASVCKMVVAHTEKKSLSDFAKTRRDAIDFFEFVDKFSSNGLSAEQYNILRRASSDDFSSADAFLNYLKISGVSDKIVIKKIFERASLLKVLNEHS
jgi:hypothetical protein